MDPVDARNIRQVIHFPHPYNRCLYKQNVTIGAICQTVSQREKTVPHGTVVTVRVGMPISGCRSCPTLCAPWQRHTHAGLIH